VKVSLSLYYSDFVPQCIFREKMCQTFMVQLFMRIASFLVLPSIRNLLNSTVGHQRTTSSKYSSCPHVVLRYLLVPLHPGTSCPPGDVARKCDAAQQYIEILNMKKALKLKLTMFQIYLGLTVISIQ
jgi:hypothetical protein